MFVEFLYNLTIPSSAVSRLVIVYCVSAPAAPKPAMWSPGSGGGGSAPASKPFVPKTSPPAPTAPGGPKGAPPKPTGVGAVKGKRGDATMFKSGDSAPGGARIPVCASCGGPIR